MLENNFKNIYNNRVDKEINSFIKNTIESSRKVNENKNNIFSSNWNHSSNFKLKNHTNENILYRNKFLKNTPLREKLMDEISKKDKGIFLPEIKSPNVNREKIDLNNNICSHISITPKETHTISIMRKLKNEPNNELSTENTIFYKNIKLNRIIKANCNFLNDNINSISTETNSARKYNSAKLNNIQSLNGDSNKNGMNLISNESISNNNIIMPKLTLRRPASNLNFLQSFENEINFWKKNKINENNNLNNFDKSRNKRNKVCKSQEIKGRINIPLNDIGIYNVFANMRNFMPKFHKIKIEKGSEKQLGNSLTKKISFENSKLLDNVFKKKTLIQ